MTMVTDLGTEKSKASESHSFKFFCGFYCFVFKFSCFEHSKLGMRFMSLYSASHLMCEKMEDFDI